VCCPCVCQAGVGDVLRVLVQKAQQGMLQGPEGPPLQMGTCVSGATASSSLLVSGLFHTQDGHRGVSRNTAMVVPVVLLRST
jgi:hypothetical protein